MEDITVNYDSKFYKLLDQFEDLENKRTHEKMTIAKEIICESKDSSEQRLKVIDIFSLHLFNLEMRYPLKKGLASLIQSLCMTPGYDLNEVEYGLNSILVSYLKEAKFGNNFDLQYCKLLNESLFVCSDNFPIGQTILRNNFELIIRFHSETLDCLTTEIEMMGNQEDSAPTLYPIQNLTKTLSYCLQDRKRIGFSNEDDQEKDCLLNLNHSLVKFIMIESAPAHHRLSASISLGNLLKLMHSDNLIDLVLYSQPCLTESNINLYASQTLSPLTWQLVWGGLFSSLIPKELVLKSKNSLLFYIELFHRINSCLEDLHHNSLLTIAHSRNLLTWSEKVCQLLREENIHELVSNQDFQQNESLISTLLDHVWSNWDHYIDLVKTNAKMIFKNALTLHVLSYQGESQLHVDPFLTEVLKHLLDLPWHCKGKYGALSQLVGLISTLQVLELRPSLIQEMLDGMSDGNTSSNICELFCTLIEKHLSESDKRTWEVMWLNPLAKVLCLGSKQQKIIIKQIILPRLFKSNQSCINYLREQLTSMSHSNLFKSSSLCALISCLKVAKMKNASFFYPSEDTCILQISNLWKNCLPLSTVRMMLCHSDDEVRLDSLDLLCISPKSTEALDEKDLELALFFFRKNLDIQSRAFRQKTASAFKKLFSRIKNSALQNNRNKEADQHDCIVKLYRKFLEELVCCIKDNIFLEANFPRRCVTIQFLLLLKESFGFHHGENEKMSLLSIPVDSSLCMSLFFFIRDSYESNKEIAFGLLCSLPSSLMPFLKRDTLEETLEIGFKLASSTRPPDCITAAYIFRLLHKFGIPSTSIPHIIESESGHENLSFSSSHVLLDLLLKKLKQELGVAQKNLLEAASSGPMYGLVVSLSLVLGDVSVYSMKKNHLWLLFFKNLLTICMDIGATVHPIVCNASPEGYLPSSECVKNYQTTIKRAVGRQFSTPSNRNKNEEIMKDSSTEIVKGKAVSAQILLLCSWRAHKEVSLLLGQLAEICLPSELLKARDFKEMGIYFMNHLSEVKHRGAFEQAFLGFSKLCKELWRSQTIELSTLPDMWLNETLEMIIGDEVHTASICATRRSAGFPFIVQALLITEPDTENMKCLKRTFGKLLNYSFKEGDVSQKVHAFNILRVLYRDSTLGENVMPFVADGLKAAILGLKSESWSLCNSSNLLFSTLVTRIFGINHSKSHKNNLMTSKAFFKQYPQLFSFLEKELQAASQTNANSHCSTNLYPILLLLSRLYPSNMELEVQDGRYKLSSFSGLVEQCVSNSPVWWIRRLASIAIVPLLTKESEIITLENSFAILKDITVMQNSLHGNCLKIYKIIEEKYSPTLQNFPEVNQLISNSISECLWIIESERNLSTTKIAFLELLVLLCKLNATFYNLKTSFLLDCLSFHIEKKVVSDLFLASLTNASLCFILQSYKEEMCTWEMLETVLSNTLSIEAYEPKFTSLNCLSWLLDCPETISDEGTLDAKIFMKNFEWPLHPSTKKTLAKNALNSSKILNILFSMVERFDEHPISLTYAFNLIVCYYSSNPHSSEITNRHVNVMVEFENLLDKMEITFIEDVLVSIIPYTGYLALIIYNNPSLIKTPASIALLQRWSLYLHYNVSDECSSLRRLAVTRTITQTLSIMICTIHTELSLPLWDAAVILLQDDEPEIRECAVRLVASLSQCLGVETGYGSEIVSGLALELLLEHFVVCFGQAQSSHCTTLLVHWALQRDPLPIEAGEEDYQAFDKGEMNVFSEHVSLTRLACSCLSSLVESLLTSFFTFPTLPWNSNALVINSANTDKLLQNCLLEARHLMQDISQCNLAHIFLCHQMDDLMIKLYQRVSVLKAFNFFTAPNDDIHIFKTEIDLLRKTIPNLFLDSIYKMCNSCIVSQ